MNKWEYRLLFGPESSNIFVLNQITHFSVFFTKPRAHLLIYVLHVVKQIFQDSSSFSANRYNEGQSSEDTEPLNSHKEALTARAPSP